MLYEDIYGHARRLDNREARVVERSIFGKDPDRKGKAAAFEREPVLSTKLDQSVIDAFFASKEELPVSEAAPPDASAPGAAQGEGSDAADGISPAKGAS